MKVLHHYIVTASVLYRFKRVVGFEQKFCQNVHEKIDRLIITDIDTPIDIPWSNATVIRTNLSIDGLFNHSRARNVGLSFALEHGYDWLIDGDCDRVLLEFPDKMPDNFDVTQVPIYSSSESETDEDLVDKWRMGNMKFTPGSWFVISRAAFSTVRFHEGYKFNRFEDLDFYFIVCPSFGFRIDLTGTGVGKGIHLWHPDSERGYKYEAHNGKLYRERQELYNRLKSEHGGTLPRKTPAECP